MMSGKLSPISPGEILAEEFLEPMNLSQNALARHIGVPPSRINDIVKGRRAINADMASRLGQAFGMTPQFWLNLQSHYELRKLEREKPVKIKQLKVA